VRERPSGIVTFLFTDIEGSTRMLQTLGAEAYGRILDTHRQLLRAAFQRHGGYEEGTEGDSFMVAFGRPAEALAAAADTQQALAAHAWPAGQRVRVRAGIHTGEVAASASGYVGVAVHRAARIAAAGHGDQVLVSQTTFDLVRDLGLPYRLVDLGQHRLKDLTEPQHLYQLEPADGGATREFPPLRTAGSRPTNLPPQPSALFGRATETEQLAALLRRADVRLVTLTGSGGTGKTSLALQVGAALLDDFEDGVWFVSLGAITDPSLVIPAIAAALSLHEAAGQSLGAFLASKKLLIVVDNFEQVMPAAPALGELVGNTAAVKLLVTSREGLHIRGERTFLVPPLASADCVALFVNRAEAVNSAFRLTDANTRAIAELCARLDGLPLAIELAAARVNLLDPQQMISRLGDRLRLLTGGARDLPERHQTLRATLEWSHGLLKPDEQELFARLALFAGGFTLDAAEAICSADLDGVGSLVDKSLVRGGSGRFRMLETVRDYALERLEASGEAAELRNSHATYFADLAERVYPYRISAEAEHSAALEADIDNLRAALDWLESTDRERALAMAANLGWFWHVHSHLAEGRARLAGLLNDSPSSGADRARALAALGEITGWQGDLATTRAAIDEAAELFAENGLEQERALALYELGWGLFAAGEDETARQAMESSLLLQRSIGDELLINRAQLGLLQMLVAVGDVEQVEPLARESLVVSRRLGDPRGEHFAQHFLADSALIGGDVAVALELYRQALRAAVPLGDRIEISFEVQGVAMSLAGTGRYYEAVRLAAAAAAELESLGFDWTAVRFWNDLLTRHIGQANEQLDESVAATAAAEGRAMGMAGAIEQALQA
jgi:predicted ATPase/class 3 adenylate cyclase